MKNQLILFEFYYIFYNFIVLKLLYLIKCSYLICCTINSILKYIKRNLQMEILRDSIKLQEENKMMKKLTLL